MNKTILFDLDGTLIKTPDIIIEAFKEIFKKYFSDVDIEKIDFTEFLGCSLWSTFERFTDNKDVVDKAISEYRKITDEKISLGLEAYEGALKTFKSLKNDNYLIGVVTSKMALTAQMHLKMVGLLEYVDCIIGYEDVNEHKPNPEGLLKAMELLGSNKEFTVYVGDHENDILAAKNANISSCVVSYSKRLNVVLGYYPEFVIDKLEHLIDIY